MLKWKVNIKINYYITNDIEHNEVIKFCRIIDDLRKYPLFDIAYRKENTTYFSVLENIDIFKDIKITVPIYELKEGNYNIIKNNEIAKK